MKRANKKKYIAHEKATTSKKIPKPLIKDVLTVFSNSEYLASLSNHSLLFSGSFP